jgi:hypothetical protein
MEGFRVNSDGINQVFQIHFPGPPETFELAVFNRWGEALYGSGVYIYSLKYTFNGKEVELKGQLTIRK